MKLLVPILIGILVIGGTVVGLGFAGVIHIPGISPTKKSKSAEPAPAEETEPKAEEPTLSEPPPTVVASTVNEATPEPEITRRVDGTDRLAKLWSSMETDALVKVLDQWNDRDALQVLAKMDDKMLAELLSALPPDKAARISMGIKSLDKGGK